MKPRKPILVCGSDAVKVSMVCLMLRLQGNYKPSACDSHGLSACLKTNFYRGALLLEKRHEDLGAIAVLVYEAHKVPALAVHDDCSSATLRGHVAMLTEIKRGPKPLTRQELA